MYPRISDLFKDLLGIDLPFPIYSFGFMVAVAILLGAWLTGKELDRLYREGRLKGIRVPAEDKNRKTRRKRMKEVPPSVIMGNVTIIAALAGVIGAKIFHILENLGEFFTDPMGMLFSTGGLTFYGGLIVAGIAVAWYVRKKGLHLWTFADAIAPALMLAYGVGRIGCHLAGDGDWGIVADMSKKPSWVPTWLWAETYPNNILGVNIPAPGVYPTPLYEFMLSLLFFGVLWALRRHPFRAGWLFSLYLIFNGVERFLIELIRVNNRFDVFGVQVTQAEVISLMLVIAGSIGLYLTSRRREEVSEVASPVVASTAS